MSDARRMARPVRLSTAIICVALTTTACGDAEIGANEVSSETVSDELTQDILVLTPESDGSWPVVMLLHGLDGVGEAMAETGARLAENGLVVFAPTYRTDMSTEQGMADLESDLTCAYRYAIANATDSMTTSIVPIISLGCSVDA